jgi:hypothetical protein
MSNNDIVQKLWNLCDVLRDDGINYSDYVTELVGVYQARTHRIVSNNEGQLIAGFMCVKGRYHEFSFYPFCT